LTAHLQGFKNLEGLAFKTRLRNSAPVRCFHLKASILSGEKHLTSAKDNIQNEKM